MDVHQMTPVTGKRRDRLVVRVAVVYLLSAWTVVVIVDALNLLGSRDALATASPVMPYMWFHLFREGGITEALQWSALAGTAITAAFVAGKLSGSEATRGGRMFWVLIAVAAGWMLIEDAGNLRHMLRNYVLPMAGGSRSVSIAVEVGYYATLASIPLYALARYWRWPWQSLLARRYLIGGFVLYGFAAAASATRDFGGVQGWYSMAGSLLQEYLFRGRLVPVTPDFWSEAFWPDGADPTGYLLMDLLWEESVELMAASLLLASALAYLQHLRLRSSARPQSSLGTASPQ